MIFACKSHVQWKLIKQCVLWVLVIQYQAKTINIWSFSIEIKEKFKNISTELYFTFVFLTARCSLRGPLQILCTIIMAKLGDVYDLHDGKITDIHQKSWNSERECLRVYVSYTPQGMQSILLAPNPIPITNVLKAHTMFLPPREWNDGTLASTFLGVILHGDLLCFAFVVCCLVLSDWEYVAM